MSITREEVENIAKLACLELSEEEKQRYTQELGDIIEYISYLHELDTSKVLPTFHIHSKAAPFRKDAKRSLLTREKALLNAPRQEEGFFKVPPILG